MNDGRYRHLKFHGDNPDQKKVAAYLNDLFEYAFKTRSSDIHIKINDVSDSMENRDTSIRTRKNGRLTKYGEVPPAFGLLMRDMIFNKAKIARSSSNEAHDSRMKLFYDHYIDARVSVLPLTDRATSIVCRILDQDNSRLSIEAFDIDEMKKHVLKSCVKKTEGMILVSGPTGSGKTTTLYTLLNSAYTGENSVITIEDPVEYFVDDYTQIDVTGALPFSNALRHVLRQDPDIIMVGEIRDEASAATAVKSSESGHILLSTTHAIDSLSSVSRIEGLGVTREQISGVLLALLAQRLVRKIDDNAPITWEEPSDVERAWLKHNGIYFEGARFPKVAYEHMNGRIPIMELVEITSAVREVLSRPGDRSAELLELIAMQPQFETLAQCGVKLAIAGKTTLSEVMGVTRDNRPLPVSKRIEQIMLERGWLSVFDLNEALRILVKHKENGMVVSLESIIIEQGFATASQLDSARAIMRQERSPQPFVDVTTVQLPMRRTIENAAA